MEIQTTVIHVILGLELFMNSILLFPYLDGLKKCFIRIYMYSMPFKVLSQVINVFYVMISILLVDSVYKMNITENKILEYQAQRNMYLCAFAIFLYLNLKRMVKILHSSFLTDKDQTYILKQHKSAEDFLKTVVDKYNAEQEKNRKLEDKIKELVEKVENQIDEISQIEKNKKAYLKLKDKYEDLMAKHLRETKKQK